MSQQLQDEALPPARHSAEETGDASILTMLPNWWVVALPFVTAAVIVVGALFDRTKQLHEIRKLQLDIAALQSAKAARETRIVTPTAEEIKMYGRLRIIHRQMTMLGVTLTFLVLSLCVLRATEGHPIAYAKTIIREAATFLEGAVGD